MTPARDMNALLAFWLDEVGPKGWFDGTPAVDDAIRDRWGALWQDAREGRFTGWGDGGREALAFLILVDQFPRNMFRGDGRSFATDALARDVARRAIARNADLQVAGFTRNFFYLPFEHSEALADQDWAVDLIAERVDDPSGRHLFHARVHRAAIARFGRFPWRNAALGRPSTPDEQALLDRGGYGALVKDMETPPAADRKTRLA